MQVLAEVLENSGMFGRDRGKVVERFVGSGRETCGGNVMAEDTAINDLREEGRLRNHLAQEVRDVLLTLGRKSLLVSRATAEGDDYYLPLVGGDTRSSDQAGGQQGTAQRHSRGATQKFAAAPGEPPCEFSGSGRSRGGQASPVPGGLR